MNNKSKELHAAALFGDLLVALGKRDSIRVMLQELDGIPSDVLIKELLDRFEAIVDERRKRAGQERPEDSGVAPRWEIHVKSPLQTPAPPKPTVASRPFLPPNPPPPRTPSPSESAKPPKTVEAPKPQKPVESVKPPKPVEVPKPPRHVEVPKPSKPVNAPEISVPPVPEKHPLPKEPVIEAPVPLAEPRVPYELADEDTVYLHAVTSVPEGETGSPTPFMLEEKGIESRSFAFAFDYKGLRFYLSRIKPDSLSVSKTGVLLLGKPETVRLHGVHESTINDLRAHGLLLPFAFGTVVQGREELVSRIDGHFQELTAALESLRKTTWWNLSVFALDSRLAQLIQPDGSLAKREIEKNRKTFSTPTQPLRLDIKTLERILNRQKKLAESIHEELSNIAERSDVDMMIGLTSGSSDDWKVILKASYDVPARRLPKFNRAVTDLQYQHFLLELMLSLSGDVEAFAFH